MALNVTIRVDSSIHIGSGHVMRCLTLADELKSTCDAEVNFICRDFKGQIGEIIQQRGYSLTLLHELDQIYKPTNDDPTHAEWLGVSWEQDSKETINAMKGRKADWLIIDHYGIEQRWHNKLKPYTNKIMVIDDLADRKLNCNLLLDQTYGRNAENYQSIVSSNAKLLLGTKYALLRPEFAIMRPKAVDKRNEFNGVKRILISMGGMDPDNVTGRILETLAQVEWDKSLVVDVVLGLDSTYLEYLKNQVAEYQFTVNFLSNVNNMAELMFKADLAIGAGGSTSWERCCLGLPTLIVITADNQNEIVHQLEKANTVVSIGRYDSIDIVNVARILSDFTHSFSKFSQMSKNAFNICKGNGALLCVKEILCC